MNLIDELNHASGVIATRRVLEEILMERGRQDEKWGQQDHPNGTGEAYDILDAINARHECQVAFRGNVGTWKHVLNEEVHEAFAEKDTDKLREELIQVAAVAAAWIEAIDRANN